MFAFLRLDRVLWERTLVVGNIYRFQFGDVLLVAAACGLAWLIWRRRKVAVLLGGMLAIMSFIVITYRAPQSVEYLMPAYVPVALCIGSAAEWVPRLARRIAGQANAEPTRFLAASLIGLLLLPVAALGRANLPSYLVLHRDRSARIYAESVLLGAPPDAQVLANWHWYTPLAYLQLVEGRRPDIEITYVYPQGATEMPQAWAQRIAREIETSDRPLVVTAYSLGEAFRVRAGPSTEVPSGLMRLDVDLGGRIRLLGYRLAGPDVVRPGDWLTLDIAWQPLVPLDRGYSLFVHLVGPDGVPLGQRDVRHDGAPWGSGMCGTTAQRATAPARCWWTATRSPSI